MRRLVSCGFGTGRRSGLLSVHRLLISMMRATQQKMHLTLYMSTATIEAPTVSGFPVQCAGYGQYHYRQPNANIGVSAQGCAETPIPVR